MNPRSRTLAARTLPVGIAVAALVAAAAIALAGYQNQQGPASGASAPSGVPSSDAADAALIQQKQAVLAAHTSTTGSTEIGLDLTQRSIDDPESLWVVVNPNRPLAPMDYVPSDLVEVPVPHTWQPRLREEAADALVTMFDAAQAAGFTLASNSTYRSYDDQVSIYGQGAPGVAKPGHSEHQLGLAADIGTDRGCTFDCMNDAPESAWLQEHAWEFGYVLRYPRDKVDITGYPWESWHYRYVGTDLAAEMHNSGIRTLEELFSLPPGKTPTI